MTRLNHRQTLTFISLLLAAVICFSLSAVPSPVVSASDIDEPEENMLYYTALGDSIPNGYCADDTPELIGYPSLIAEDLQALNQTGIGFTQFTKNGLTTAKLNELFLIQPEVQEALSKADVITLTIGANDLMNEFKRVSREILDCQTKFRTADEALQALQEGISENPFLLVDVVSAVAGWDYDSFQEQWLLTAETIHSLRKADSQMAVTTIYNPVENAGLPDTLNAVVKNLIGKMNEIIYEHAEEYDYQAVDLLNSGIAEHTQSDGLHPDQQGQELIRSLIEASLDMQLVEAVDAADEMQAEEARLTAKRIAAEKKAAELREQKARRQRIFRRGLLAGGCILLILFIITVISRIRRKRMQKKAL